jgi:hypothetical protein
LEVLREILRRMYGAIQTDGVWQRHYNKELYSLFNVDIIKRIKINRDGQDVIRRKNEEIVKRIMPVKLKVKGRKVDKE